MIGRTSHQIVGAKLPSNRQVLQVLFQNIRFVYMYKGEVEVSAKLALQAVMLFWEQARIPTRRIDKCQEKLVELYNKWVVIKKTDPCNFITARLVAALDNAKVSDGMAVHILVAAAEALGHRVEDLVINRSSIHRLRHENRLRGSKEIATNFNDNV